MQTDRFTVGVETKGKKNVRESEVMFGCQLRKGYQLFYEKSTKIMQYVNLPKETAFNW